MIYRLAEIIDAFGDCRTAIVVPVPHSNLIRTFITSSFDKIIARLCPEFSRGYEIIVPAELRKRSSLPTNDILGLQLKSLYKRTLYVRVIISTILMHEDVI